MVRSLAAVRGLFLSESEKNVLNLLQCNCTNDTETAIDDLLRLDNGRNICVRKEIVNEASVIRTNASQIVANLSANCKINLREPPDEFN